LNASETVAQNFSSQKETFGAAHHALEDTSQKLSDFDHSALKAVQAFEDKIKQLDDITQKLNSENATFDMLVSSRAKELAQIADLNKMTDDTFTEYLERGKGLSMDLRTVTSSADQTITEHLAAFRSEIANGKKLSQQTLEALEATATESLTPLTLKPLDVDVAPLEIEPIEAEFKTPVLDSPHPLEGPNKAVNITPDVITTDIAKNKKSLFGSSPKVSEPLELQEEDLVMPSMSIAESEKPLNPKRPFENMIDVMGIDPKRAVSEKLVSDISTAFVTDEALIKVIAVNGLTELSKYIKAHEQYGATYQSSAAYYEAQYKKTINPEIMNKDSISSHLSSNAGRHFIISLLG